MSEVKNGRKEPIGQKVKRFYKKHEAGLFELSVYAVCAAAVGADCYAGNIYARGKIDAGLRRVFDVNPDLETGLRSAIKQLDEIDKARNENWK